MKRSKPVRAIARRVVFVVNGRRRKTVTDRITHRQAVRECGEDTWFAVGDRRRIRRKMCQAVVIEIEYELVVSLVGPGATHHIGMDDAKHIARGGMAL